MHPDLSTADVARRCGTTTAHVQKLARLGELPHYRIGGVYRFSSDEIERWLHARHVGLGDEDDLEAYIREILAAAPAPTLEQIERVRGLVRAVGRTGGSA
ncbi:MAG: helix-turn-helix domain-containing protein [Dehalococcoidia bacterium]